MKDAGFKETLTRLGFKTYREYLKSEHWQHIRRKVFAVKGNLCQCCKVNKATSIHHRSYDVRTMLGINIKALVPICDGCHLKIEFSNGRKNKLRQANKKLKKATTSPRG